MKKVIRAKSPVRIGLGGGGTDVSPYCDEFGGVVLNVTINKYAYATLRLREDLKVVFKSEDMNLQESFENLSAVKIDGGKLDLLKSVAIRLGQNLPVGFELTTCCNVPPRSGLGSSAAVFAVIIAVFNHLEKERRLSLYETADLAYQIERVDLANMGGKQDQYATVFGGLNFIEFKKNDFVRVEEVKLNHHIREEFPESLVLFHIGERGNSGDVIEDQQKNIKKGTSLQAMHLAKNLAYRMKEALFSSDINLFGELLNESWQVKKKFSSKISNDFIDDLYATGLNNGAIGGKVSGAGGGGHMFFVVETGKNNQLINAMEAKGIKHVPFDFTYKGLRTWESTDRYLI